MVKELVPPKQAYSEMRKAFQNRQASMPKFGGEALSAAETVAPAEKPASPVVEPKPVSGPQPTSPTTPSRGEP